MWEDILLSYCLLSGRREGPMVPKKLIETKAACTTLAIDRAIGNCNRSCRRDAGSLLIGRIGGVGVCLSRYLIIATSSTQLLTFSSLQSGVKCKNSALKSCEGGQRNEDTCLWLYPTGLARQTGFSRVARGNFTQPRKQLFEGLCGLQTVY